MSDTGSLFAARGLRVFFACLVLAAGAGKAADLPGFIAVVESYRSLPAAAIAPAAWLLILTEFGLAAWLASGHRLRAAALATAGHRPTAARHHGGAGSAGRRLGRCPHAQEGVAGLLGTSARGFGADADAHGIGGARRGNRNLRHRIVDDRQGWRVGRTRGTGRGSRRARTRRTCGHQAWPSPRSGIGPREDASAGSRRGLNQRDRRRRAAGSIRVIIRP